jgi:N-acetylmuramoyl-L-alanine amidase
MANCALMQRALQHLPFALRLPIRPRVFRPGFVMTIHTMWTFITAVTHLRRLSRACASRGQHRFLKTAALLGACAALPCSAAYVVIDTGHTPQRPGATGASGRVEYQYNLALSSAVVQNLQAHGDRVSRTSADGREIKLQDRSTSAPDADLFVSIHHDSIQQQWIDAGRRREFHGYAIFVSQRNGHYEQSLRCAQAIGEHMLAAGETPSLYHATHCAAHGAHAGGVGRSGSHRESRRRGTAGQARDDRPSRTGNCRWRRCLSSKVNTWCELRPGIGPLQPRSGNLIH